MNFDLNAQSSPQRRPNRQPAPAQPSSPRKAPVRKPSTASVPISVYRELSAELQATQTMLDSLHGQNQHLRKQNVHLQQEVDSIVQATQKRQHVVGGQNKSSGGGGHRSDLTVNPQSFVVPEATAAMQENIDYPSVEVPPQLRRAVQGYPQQFAPVMPPRVSEPPRPQEMPIMPDGIEPLVVRSPEVMQNLVHQQLSQAPGQPQGQSTAPFSPSRRQMAVETLNKIFTGREQPLPRRALDEESSDEIHTGWLVLIVLLIVVTAFGTGFMIVRPFLSTNR